MRLTLRSFFEQKLMYKAFQEKIMLITLATVSLDPEYVYRMPGIYENLKCVYVSRYLKSLAPLEQT